MQAKLKEQLKHLKEAELKLDSFKLKKVVQNGLEKYYSLTTMQTMETPDPDYLKMEADFESARNLVQKTQEHILEKLRGKWEESRKENLGSESVERENEYGTSADESIDIVLKRRNMRALLRILRNMDITLETTWNEGQKMLANSSTFQADKRLMEMDKIDQLTVFKNYIHDLERKAYVHHLLSPDAPDDVEIRRERKNRDRFFSLLESFKKIGYIQSSTLWIDVVQVLSKRVEFRAMLTQKGSSPLDLFKIFVGKVKKTESQEKCDFDDVDQNIQNNDDLAKNKAGLPSKSTTNDSSKNRKVSINIELVQKLKLQCFNINYFLTIVSECQTY